MSDPTAGLFNKARNQQRTTNAASEQVRPFGPGATGWFAEPQKPAGYNILPFMKKPADKAYDENHKRWEQARDAWNRSEAQRVGSVRQTAFDATMGQKAADDQATHQQGIQEIQRQGQAAGASQAQVSRAQADMTGDSAAKAKAEELEQQQAMAAAQRGIVDDQYKSQAQNIQLIDSSILAGWDAQKLQEYKKQLSSALEVRVFELDKSLGGKVRQLVGITGIGGALALGSGVSQQGKGSSSAWFNSNGTNTLGDPVLFGADKLLYSQDVQNIAKKLGEVNQLLAQKQKDTELQGQWSAEAKPYYDAIVQPFIMFPNGLGKKSSDDLVLEVNSIKGHIEAVRMLRQSNQPLYDAIIKYGKQAWPQDQAKGMQLIQQAISTNRASIEAFYAQEDANRGNGVR